MITTPYKILIKSDKIHREEVRGDKLTVFTRFLNIQTMICMFILSLRKNKGSSPGRGTGPFSDFGSAFKPGRRPLATYFISNRNL